VRIVGEVLAYAAFAVVIGALSVWPPYDLLETDEAIISVAFVHAGERVGECRKLTQEELDALPPNMRKPSDCPRERHPVRIELRSGDDVLVADTMLPSGLWSDGKANIYERVIVPAGRHEVFVGMNDSGGDDAFDYERKLAVDMRPGQNLVVRFDGQAKRFVIK
jgi:hypothetical protein